MHLINITDSAGRSQQHEIKPHEALILGKAMDCDIRIDNPYLSRRHARLTVADGGILFEDLNSTNGSWHGDRKLESYGPLAVQDRLRLGHEIFLSVDDAQPTHPPGGHTGNVREPNAISTYASGERETDEDMALKQEIQFKILEFLDLRKRGTLDQLSHEELRNETRAAAQALLDTGQIHIPRDVDRERLLEGVIAEAIGYGPIEPFLADESVTEVMVNGPNQIYIERKGKLEAVATRFSGEMSLMNVIERIVTPLGRRIDEGSPMIDARLPDGSRVNAIIPPLALAGPTLTIRKFAKNRFHMQDLVNSGTLSPGMAEFLEVCVKYRRNMVVSGGTGSGKTTTLNILSDYIPDNERILTIEDSAELQLSQNHVVSLEGRPANVEGKGGVTIRDLVKNSLRMRPDRIVVGECRSGEALDMLQAMNTGHDGSMTTAHANSPRDVLARLETMVMMSGLDLPSRAIREQIGSAVEIICQQMRMSDGKRRIVSIVEVGTMEGEIIGLQEIFSFKQQGLDSDGNIIGKHVGCGYAPTFYTALKESGLTLNWEIFSDKAE
nr:ATPase, T2SS/T4P/T4SS family [uncultured Halomonas sp.]